MIKKTIETLKIRKIKSIFFTTSATQTDPDLALCHIERQIDTPTLTPKNTGRLARYYSYTTQTLHPFFFAISKEVCLDRYKNGCRQTA